MKNIVRIIVFSAAILFALPATSQHQQLSLPKAIEIGLANNFDISIASQQTNIASVSNTWGFAGRYPTVSLGATTLYSGDLINDASNGNLATSASAKVQWTLFGGMKVNVNKSILNLKYDLAKGSEELQIENSVKDIVLAYYAIVIESKLHRLYKDVLVLSKDRYEREKVAYDLGGSDSYTLIQAQSAYLADEKRLVQQEMVVRSSLYQLNTLINVDINTQWSFSNEITIPNNEYSLDVMQQMMLADNKTIKNQYINQKIADQNIDLAKSNLYPTVALIGELGYRNVVSAGNIPTVNSFTPGVGATVNFNLYNGGTARRNVQIAKLNSEIAQSGSDQIRQYMISQLLRNYDGYLYNKNLVELSNREVEAVKISLDLSSEKYANGSINSFDFRQVQMEYYQAIYSQARYEYELIKSNTNLAQIIGTILKN